jgi:hypothetical protein
MFASNPDVAFGDVLLAEQQIRGNHNPGAGGWPTIKYFNKKTGYEGAAYQKKTDGSMCDELGDMTYMQAYVEEAGQTSLCNVVTKAGCSEKQSEFIDKTKSLSKDSLNQQLQRLEGMSGKSMTAPLRSWLTQRIAILKQLIGGVHDEL